MLPSSGRLRQMIYSFQAGGLMIRLIRVRGRERCSRASFLQR